MARPRLALAGPPLFLARMRVDMVGGWNDASSVLAAARSVLRFRLGGLDARSDRLGDSGRWDGRRTAGGRWCVSRLLPFPFWNMVGSTVSVFSVRDWPLAWPEVVL